MSNFEFVRNKILSFPDMVETPHFEKTSLRWKKKIVVTYDYKKDLACFKLSLVDQDVFSKTNTENIYPVPNKWGLQGWTFVHLNKIPIEILDDLIQCSMQEVISKKK